MAAGQLAGTNALVTGGNKGIGFEVARQLGEMGAAVLVGARDAERGETAASALRDAGLDARFLPIDVTGAGAVHAAAAQIGALDILVNNAGIGLSHIPPSTLDVTILQTVLDTNLLGAVRVTQAFLPLLRASGRGRIVNVSSSLGSLHHLSDPQWAGHQSLFSAYSLSKVALNAFTALLAAELAGSTVKVNAVEPGYTATDMTGGQGFQTPSDAARTIVRYATLGDDGPTGGFFDARGRMPW